jgi:RNA polymerase sigma factor (sigma-70 family)
MVELHLLPDHACWCDWVARRLPRNRQAEADDVVQEAYAAAITARTGPRERTEQGAKRWFRGILRNVLRTAIRGWRRRGRHERLMGHTDGVDGEDPGEVASTHLSPEDLLRYRELSRGVHAALETLPVVQRELVRRVILEKLRLSYAAGALGLQPGDASRRLWRAKQALRRMLARLDAR